MYFSEVIEKSKKSKWEPDKLYILQGYPGGTWLKGLNLNGSLRSYTFGNDLFERDIFITFMDFEECCT